MRVAILDICRLCSSPATTAQTRHDGMEDAATAQESAKEQQKYNTSDYANDNARNGSTTQSSAAARSLDPDCLSSVGSHWGQEALGSSRCGSLGDSGHAVASSMDWRSGSDSRR